MAKHKRRYRAAKQVADDAQQSSLHPPVDQPTADFNDPVMHARVWQIDHLGIQAYLVALAAFQRGLRVIFHYELASKSERFGYLSGPGHLGEFFSVSDGYRCHCFRRTLGDLTSKASSALVDNKQQTKELLARHGVDVPDGVLLGENPAESAGRFLARHPDRRFLLKPLAGTEGKGVIRNLSPPAVAEHVSAAGQAEASMLLEEFVPGTDYRVYVTGGRYIAALARVPANVTGNGRDSIRQLINRKNALRRAHPVYRRDPIALDTSMKERLARDGLSLDAVPAAGQRVFLDDVPSVHRGGDVEDVTDSLPHSVREQAIRAQQALALPNTGLDLMVSGAGTVQERVVVLEANQCPYIALLSLPLDPATPSPGNRVAESIIDHYFPASVTNHRHTRASFDFMQICRTLQSGVASEIALPVLGQEWVHQRKNIPAVRVDGSVPEKIRRAMLLQGIHAGFVQTETGDVIVDWVAPKDRARRFADTLEAKLVG